MRPAEPVVVTGLSDEEDAARLLALHFQSDLYVCRNCEVHYRCCTKFEDDNCPRCNMPLSSKGVPPLKAKHKHT